MSISCSVYVAFGVYVPREQWASADLYDECDRLDDVMNGLGVAARYGISHLSAGTYDRDEIFLVVGRAKRIEPGTFVTMPDAPDADMGWWMRLSRVAYAAGYRDLGKAGWMAIPDES